MRREWIPIPYMGDSPETRTDPSGNMPTCMTGPESCDYGGTGGTGRNGGNGGGSNNGAGSTNSGGSSANGGTSTQDPQPASPTVTQVVSTLSSVAGVAGKLLWEAVDLVFNVSGMYHDVQTLTDSNASWWDKAGAAANLGMTIFTDLNMLDGEGEAARAAEVGAEIAESGGEDVARVVEGACSFIARTVVATQQGEQAIGKLKVGEKVWAYNPKTKKMEEEPILHVWIHKDNDLVDLTITHATHGKTTKPNSEVIHTNQKHPFLTVEKGFLPVGQIKLGMHVVQADGHLGVISGWKVVPGVKTMYNLEVAQDHTFVVGVGMWVVHNCGNPEAGSWLRESSLNNAPRQTTPGTSVISGEHVNDLGQIEPYEAHYDEYGRQIGRTDYTGGNATQGIPPIHHHATIYTPDFPAGLDLPPALDHASGEYSPSSRGLFYLL